MPRTLSANSTAAIAIKEGIEPVLILHFDMPGQVYFSTKTIDGFGAVPKILSFSGLNQGVKVNGVCSVSNINVVLEDSNGVLKNLLNVYNMVGTVVQGYLYFDGIAGGAPGTLIFKGKVAAPVDWHEGDRQLSVTIESFINSRRVGFAMETGQFTINNEIAVGKVWPIVFGKAPHVPAVLAQKKPAALLKYPINMGGAIGAEELFSITGDVDFEVTDWTLLQSYNVDEDEVIIDYGVFYVENSEEFEKDTELDVIIDGVVFTGMFSSSNPNVFQISEANAPKYEDIDFVARDPEDPDTNDPHVAWVDSQYLNLTDHYCYFEKGDGKNTEIDVAGAEYIIRRVVKQDGPKIWFEQPVKDHKSRADVLFDETKGKVNKVRALPQNGLLVDLNRFTNQIQRMLKGRYNRSSNQVSPYGQLIETLKLIKFVKGAFWGRKEGTEVRLWDPEVADIYVCNAVESTSLVSVYGIRRVNRLEQFVPIPRHYYTVTLDEATTIDSEDGPETVTTLRFTIPLAAYKEQGWKDEIYVTVQSTLSENPVEAIQYLLDTYTDLTPDATTFSTVAAELSGYEAHFAVLNHFDALQLCELLAYQIRCGLVIDSGSVKIVNLAKEASSSFTFTSANIKMQTIQTSTLDAGDITTRHIGKYRPTYEPQVSSAGYNKRYEIESRFEQNIATYGLIEREVDYFAFRTPEQVDAAVEFWGNRDSKTWKIVTFTAFHDSIILEPFDTCNFTLDFVYLGSSSTKGIVIGVNNDFINGNVQYTVLLPMESGQSSDDDLFWNYSVLSTPTNPADSLYQTTYDVQEERQELTINEFVRILEGNVTRQQTLARRRKTVGGGRNSEYDDVVTADILTDGSEADPQYEEVKVDVTNNHLDFEDGELFYTAKDINDRFYAPLRWGIHTAEITAINENTLTVKFVNELDEDDEFEEFEVAKPYTIKRSTWDDQTIDGIRYNYEDEQTRLAESNGESETQRIAPAYHVGDLIDIGYTLNYGGGWIDLNTDARTWVADC